VAVTLDRCPCGRPWTHEADTDEGRFLSTYAEEVIRRQGPVLRFGPTDGDGSIYLLPRCYMARHRFNGAMVAALFPELGQPGCLVFPELPAITCARCGLTSWNPNDVRHRFCGKCSVFHET